MTLANTNQDFSEDMSHLTPAQQQEWARISALGEDEIDDTVENAAAAPAPAAPVAPVEVDDWKHKYESAQGRLEAERLKIDEATQLARLHAERAENLQRQRQDDAATFTAERQRLAVLEKELADLKKPKAVIDKLRNSFDDEQLTELQNLVQANSTPGALTAEDAKKLFADNMREFQAQQEQTRLATQAAEFRQLIESDLPQLTKYSTDASFNAWLDSHPARPGDQILSIIKGSQAASMPTLKYWVSEFEKTLPQGTRQLANSAPTSPNVSSSSKKMSQAEFDSKIAAFMRKGDKEGGMRLIDEFESQS
jgi:uncharacterized surface protein with fasciclin (FAS1) repeats